MPRGDFNDVMKASKIYTICKGNMQYNWLLFHDGNSMLIGNKQISGKFLRYSEDLASDMGDDTLVEKVISLLKDDYSISIDKNRSGIELKPNVLKKYVSILKKYHGKSTEINLALNNFLRYYSLDNITNIPFVMSDINMKVEKIKNYKVA